MKKYTYYVDAYIIDLNQDAEGWIASVFNNKSQMIGSTNRKDTPYEALGLALFQYCNITITCYDFETKTQSTLRTRRPN